MHDEDYFEDEPVEGYCVRCRDMVQFEKPTPVWTRRGLPATRGECPSCGGTVFRMGKTDLHDALNRPAAVQLAGAAGSRRQKLAQETVYINFAELDEELAQQLAADLQKMGYAVWLHEAEPDGVSWAGGVHPALSECSRMVYVLSPASVEDDRVAAAWQFFRSKGKPVLIAQIAPISPPDALRRVARYDFVADYRAAFRQLVQSL